MSYPAAGEATVVRRALDLVFKASGALAVTFLVMIALLTVSQAVARFFGGVVPSADDFAGFCMAGAVFIGLAHTLRAGSHIRVLVVLTHLGPGVRRWTEIICCLSGAVIVGVLTWYSVEMVITTRQLGEYTLGLVPIPKWIPMLSMVIGLAIFFLAFVDELFRVLSGTLPLYAQREESTDSLPVSAE